MRVENGEREKRTRGVSRSPPDKLSDAKRLLRGGIIHQTLLSLSPSLSLSFSSPPLSLSLFLSPSVPRLSPPSFLSFGLTPLRAASVGGKRRKASRGASYETRDILRCFYYY